MPSWVVAALDFIVGLLPSLPWKDFLPGNLPSVAAQIVAGLVALWSELKALFASTPIAAPASATP